MKISQELRYELAVFCTTDSQNSSPEVLSFAHSPAIKYYYSIQSRRAPDPQKHSPSPGIPNAQTPTVWARDLCRIVSHTLSCVGTVRNLFCTRFTVPRKKAFQTAFISGNWPGSHSPKEALAGESAGGSRPLMHFAGVCGFMYVAFMLCMGKHSSGIALSYVRFLFLFFKCSICFFQYEAFFQSYSLILTFVPHNPVL